MLLLRSERENAPGISNALWIPTAWMLSISSKPLAYWFGVYGEVGEGSPLDRAFLIGLLICGVLVLMKRRLNLAKATRANVWLAVFLSYMLLSVLWSEFPATSFKRWIRELDAIIMALLVLSERDPKEAMESILRRSIYVLIPFSLLLIRYFPEYGVEFGRWSGIRMWIGVTTQKNGLGRLCLTAVFFLFWSLVKRRQVGDSHVTKYQAYLDAIVLALSFYILTGGLFSSTYSATAIGSLVAGLSLFLLLLWLKKSRIAIGTHMLRAITLALICYGVVSLFMSGSTISRFTSVLGRDESLTGRTDVWSSLLPIAMQTPVIGRGVGGFWNENTRAIYQISEGHSGYLDLLLDFGIVGILIVSMFLVSSCTRVGEGLMRDFYWNSLWICYLVMVIIHNATESSLNTMTSQMTATLVFLAVASTGIVGSTNQRHLTT
jgi:exopolysaccharide production protein ExoQ